MARTAITPANSTIAGLAPTMTTMPGTGANNGITFTNDGDTLLIVVNAGAGSATLTLDATASFGGVALTDPTEAVANDSVPNIFGPFDPSIFGSTVAVDSSLATGVTVTAVRIPRV